MICESLCGVPLLILALSQVQPRITGLAQKAHLQSEQMACHIPSGIVNLHAAALQQCQYVSETTSFGS